MTELLVSAESSACDDGIQRAVAELTPDELRILVISAGRRADLGDLATQLGLPRTAVALRRASIRRKLGIPPFEELREFVARTPTLARILHVSTPKPESPWGAPRPPVPERRAKHVLRVGIADVESLAARLAANALALRSQIAGTSSPDDRLLDEEADCLAALAADLELVASQATTAARRSTRRPVGAATG